MCLVGLIFFFRRIAKKKKAIFYENLLKRHLGKIIIMTSKKEKNYQFCTNKSKFCWLHWTLMANVLIFSDGKDANFCLGATPLSPSPKVRLWFQIETLLKLVAALK